jgi:hypothetical protein
MNDMAKTTLTAEDIVSNEAFATQRKDKQTELRAHKTHRRIDVGPFATFFFESWFTMWWQTQEMLRVEGGGAEQMADELTAYAPMVPSGRNLSATMMLQIEDEVRRSRELATLGGIEHQVSLVIGGEPVKAESEDDLDRTNAAGKASSVHFFLFPLTDSQINAMKNRTAEVQLRISHPNYNHIAILNAEQTEALAADLI